MKESEIYSSKLQKLLINMKKKNNKFIYLNKKTLSMKKI